MNKKPEGIGLIRVRPARASDSLSLARMRWALRAKGEKTIEKEAAFVKRCAAWMKKRLSNNRSWRCWIAENESGLVGNIWVHLIEKIPNPVSEGELHGYVTNFYVAPNVRGRRIGTRLLRAALDWCRRNTVDAVILWPSKRSRNLYVRHGFCASKDLFELRKGGR